MYKRLAQELTLPLIPFLLEGVAAQSGLNQEDGIHPTAEGYALVAQNVLNALEPLLKRWQRQAKDKITPLPQGEG